MKGWIRHPDNANVEISNLTLPKGWKDTVGLEDQSRTPLTVHSSTSRFASMPKVDRVASEARGVVVHCDSDAEHIHYAS